MFVVPGLHKVVMIVELINPAIEAVVDRISFERHPLSKNAKDFGSAAVFLALTLAVITWGIIFFQLFEQIKIADA